MGFITNKWTKRLTIVLIVLLLFNAVCPTMSYAWDIGGILLQPLYWLLLGIYIPVDIAVGSIILLKNMNFDDIAVVAEHAITKDIDEDTAVDTAVEVVDRVGNVINVIMGELFVGPDTIFKRKNSII